MKILTWNVAHQTRTTNTNLSDMAGALASLSPDVIVLTEYVQGLKHDHFVSELKPHGFAYWMTSPTTLSQNQIFIASRTPLEAGDIPTPHIEEAFTSNVLQVKVKDLNFDILGWRMPSFEKTDKDREKKRNLIWDWITEAAMKKSLSPFIILGDFNTGPQDSGASGHSRFNSLVRDGWIHALPSAGASWWWQNKEEYGRQIDHALLSRHFVVRSSEYITESGQYIFAKKPGAISDHAVLLVDADVKL